MENKELEVAIAITPLPVLPRWEEKQEKLQVDVDEEIAEYLAEANELVEKVMPKWCVSLMRHYLPPRPKWVEFLAEKVANLLHIRVEEVHKKPNKRITTVYRGSKVVGVAVLDIGTLVERTAAKVEAEERGLSEEDLVSIRQGLAESAAGKTVPGKSVMEGLQEDEQAEKYGRRRTSKVSKARQRSSSFQRYY